MAKGFTVKAKIQKEGTKPHHNMIMQRQERQRKVMVFSIHSGFHSVSKALCHYVLIWYNQEQAFRYQRLFINGNFARCKCLGANVLRGSINSMGW